MDKFEEVNEMANDKKKNLRRILMQCLYPPSSVAKTYFI